MAREIHIYDFDGTLFRSPDKPEWWDFSWYSAGPSLGRPCVPDKPGGDWWIGKTIQAARRSIASPDVLAVLMTGRTDTTPMRYRVPELLKQAGLSFDQVLLNPGKDTAVWKAKMAARLIQQHGPDSVHLWEDSQKNIKAIEAAVTKAGVSFVSDLIRATSKTPECELEDVENLLDQGWLEPRWRTNIKNRVARRYALRLAARKAHAQLLR